MRHLRFRRNNVNCPPPERRSGQSRCRARLTSATAGRAPEANQGREERAFLCELGPASISLRSCNGQILLRAVVQCQPEYMVFMPHVTKGLPQTLRWARMSTISAKTQRLKRAHDSRPLTRNGDRTRTCRQGFLLSRHGFGQKTGQRCEGAKPPRTVDPFSAVHSPNPQASKPRIR